MQIAIHKPVLKPVLHIIVWTCLFLFPFVIYDRPIDEPKVVLRAALSTLFLAGLFYTNTAVLIPRLLGKRRLVVYFLAIVGIILIIIGLNFGLQWFLNREFFTSHHWMKYRVLNSSIFMSFLIWATSTGVKVTGEWFRNEQLKKEMENEKLNSELALLKSQVNPHFLFNSLNSVYALANKGSDKTANAVVKLSELLRYMLYEAPDDQVELAKEADYLQNYIELQRLRMSEKTTINFDIEGETSGRMVAPMLLVPFVENAFKHGISNRERSFVGIRLSVKGNELRFEVENSVHEQQERDKTTGIGLQNVRRRLELLYPEKHRLTVKKENNRFITEMILHLS